MGERSWSTGVLTLLVGLGWSFTDARAQEPGACPEAASGPAVTLIGQVVDAATGVPLPSAVVTVEWMTAEAGALRAEVRTDSDGFYRLCRLPTGIPVTLQASFGSRATDPVTARLESPPIAYDFRLPVAEAPGVTVEARPRAGPGRVLGRARDAESLKPIEDAVVTLRRAPVPQAGAGAESTPESEIPPFQSLTDSQGRFLIPDVAAGTYYALELVHVGYGTVREPIWVPPNRTLDVDVRVPPVALEMEPIVVKAVRDRRLEIKGFYERKEWGERLGLGHFFDREDLRRRASARISHFLGQLPGLRVQCAGERDRMPSGRGCRVRPTRATCSHVTVYVDGIRVMEGTSAPRTDDLTIDDFVNLGDIAAVEVYSGAAGLPAEYAGVTGRCGVVAVWTRR